MFLAGHAVEWGAANVQWTHSFCRATGRRRHSFNHVFLPCKMSSLDWVSELLLAGSCLDWGTNQRKGLTFGTS